LGKGGGRDRNINTFANKGRGAATGVANIQSMEMYTVPDRHYRQVEDRRWWVPTAIFASSMYVIPVGPQIWFMYPDVSITKTKSMVRDYRPFSPRPLLPPTLRGVLAAFVVLDLCKAKKETWKNMISAST
jgi:hypothetical protein